jgi:hypothetical protein
MAMRPMPFAMPPMGPPPAPDQADQGASSPTGGPPIAGYHPPPPNEDWSGRPEKHIGAQMTPSRDHRSPRERARHAGGPTCHCPQCKDRHPHTGRFHEDY